MSDGWRPLKPPQRPRDASPEAVREAFGPASPFTRLARVHLLSAAGDGMIAVALAGSLFFSIDPSAARWRVGLYLVLTMAPFALVSPLIGPAIDRAKGGRRLMMVVINATRAVFALLMIGNLGNLFLFPLAFGLLVLQKGYAVAKAAIVPTTVSSHEELVERNAKLSLLSGLGGVAGAAPAALLQVLGSAGWSVALAVVAFGAATFLSLQLPRTAVVTEEEGEAERAELRSGGILLAASSMGVLRGTMGFFTFLVAFAYRGGTDDVDLTGPGTRLGAEVWGALLGRSAEAGQVGAFKLGLVAGATMLGGLAATLIAGRLRSFVPEERIMVGAMMIAAGVALFGSWSGGVLGGMIVGFVVGTAVNASKLAFDSIVQRDAPDANYGRSFARFETRFQLIWVIGAIIPVAIALPARLGFFVIACAVGFSAASFFVGLRAMPPAGKPLKVAPPVPQPLTPPADGDPTLVGPPDPAYDDTIPLDLPVAPDASSDQGDEPVDVNQLPLFDQDH